MYNFVNELNSEVELLEAEIGQLKEQLHTERGDVQRRKMLKDLEEELARTEQQHETIVAKTKEYRDTLDTIRAITQEIFKNIHCSAEQAAELLGTAECTEINLLQFLGLIEQRTNEILYAFNLAAEREMKNQNLSKDEEAKKRKERRQAENQARIEAGETVNEDEDDYADDTQDGQDRDGGEHSRAKFIGVGPKSAQGDGNADQQKALNKTGFPTTNAGEAGNDNDDLDDDKPLTLAALRSRAKASLERQQDERGGRKGKKGDKKK